LRRETMARAIHAAGKTSKPTWSRRPTAWPLLTIIAMRLGLPLWDRA